MGPDASGIELMLFVPQIDREHREIMEHAQSLQAAITGGIPQNGLQDLLEKLIDLVEDHFTSEEELMLSRGYPGYAAHREEHKRLLQQIYVVERELQLGTIQAGGALICFLDAWTRQHIVGPDKHFARYLNQAARRAGASPP